MRLIFGHEVYGVDVGARTECAHYHGKLDIIAIRFACCGDFYPCIECHRELADHVAVAWPQNRLREKAVLCGACGSELSIADYMRCQSKCPACGAMFNPGCERHWHSYFEIP